MFRRREFLKFLAMGVAGHVLDPEELLWVPGKKTIFIPDMPKGITTSQIIALELERIVPKIRDLFERDDLFYSALKENKNVEIRGKSY